jgi:phosphatidate cytidylyltransferase
VAVDDVPGVPSVPPASPARPSSAASEVGRRRLGRAPSSRGEHRRPRGLRDAGPVPRRITPGRNLPAAIGVGLALGCLILLSLYLDKRGFVVLAVVAVGIAVWELSGAFAAKAIRVSRPPLLIGTVAVLIAAFADGVEAFVVATALTLFAVLAWRLGDGPDAYLRDATASVFVALYAPFLAGFAVLALRPEDGSERVVTLVILVVCNDVGGYAAGVLTGRHPMAPTISPKKSWEGLAGSGIACVIGGLATVTLLLDGSAWAGALVGLAAALSATLGDLGESMIKRDLGIKDMGRLLPGHGGLMDRLDSLLPAAPGIYLLLALLVPVAS